MTPCSCLNRSWCFTATATAIIHSNRSRLLSLALRLVAVHCTGASRALNHMDKVEFRYE